MKVASLVLDVVNALTHTGRSDVESKHVLKQSVTCLKCVVANQRQEYGPDPSRMMAIRGTWWSWSSRWALLDNHARSVTDSWQQQQNNDRASSTLRMIWMSWVQVGSGTQGGGVRGRRSPRTNGDLHCQDLKATRDSYQPSQSSCTLDATAAIQALHNTRSIIATSCSYHIRR
jgi:hypothetical protein